MPADGAEADRIGLFLRISPMRQVFDLSRRFSENRFPLFGAPLV
jgi:hypothetical protein